MDYNGTKLHFYYDASGSPLSVIYNNTYYYVLNLQGDVVGILNSSGAQVVAYTYDAWGKPLSITGTMASTLGQYNPLRYRGYVYDRESGLYYLQSRYYNPNWGRFLNADSLVSTGQGVLGNNMFAYCGNNPIIYHDPSGYAFHTFDGRMPSIASINGLVDTGGGGGIPGCGGKTGRMQSLAVIQREINYLYNTNERVVLEAKGLSFYYGVPVFKADFGDGGGFSFGIIVLDDNYKYNDTGIDTLKHEYGHRLHMNEIGVATYAVTTAIPSLIGAGLANAGMLGIDYHSQPWERVADMYGRVNRGNYEPWSDTAALAFWLYTIFISEMIGGI